MKPSKSIKPISYVKAHAAELIRDIAENQGTLVITQNGEAKAVLQDIHVYEQIQESLAMLKLLAQSKASIQRGKFKSLDAAFQEVRRRTRQP